MQFMSVVKLRVELSPTLRFTNQSVMWATLKWFNLGPQLGKSHHLKVCLEEHVMHKKLQQG
jgi:hypothetical protein